MRHRTQQRVEEICFRQMEQESTKNKKARRTRAWRTRKHAEVEIDNSLVGGPYPALALIIRKVLRMNRPDAEQDSTRMACRKLGMSHDTIAGMAHGHRPARSLVIEFAQGMGIPVNELLAASDYPLVERQAS